MAARRSVVQDHTSRGSGGRLPTEQQTKSEQAGTDERAAQPFRCQPERASQKEPVRSAVAMQHESDRGCLADRQPRDEEWHGAVRITRTGQEAIAIATEATEAPPRTGGEGVEDPRVPDQRTAAANRPAKECAEEEIFSAQPASEHWRRGGERRLEEILDARGAASAAHGHTAGG